MNDLISKVNKAKVDKSALNELISEYTPFIKSEISKTTVFGVEYDDRLSVAMLVFMNCVYQYEESKGSFLSFVSISIKNRLIDEARKLNRHSGVISLDIEKNENNTSTTPEEKATLDEYSKESERNELCEEISELSTALLDFGIEFLSLENISPKHKRSREQCAAIAYEVVGDKEIKETLFRTKRLAQSELAKRFNLSEKTIEKHRKYIVTLSVILSGDFPGIKAFIPKKEVER